ncbi:hypothetical protein BDV93DRAFT_220626 [Ceratobasidium sp. AG-I]|nr:hypothetical protein BDV93DRAFT_220626 [Ceratobasidium sp. AG-I]
MRLAFEYTITRKYPWRFVSTSIAVASFLVLLGLVYTNIAIVGLNPISQYSDHFTASTSPSWRDRINVRKLGGFNLGCEPAMLVAGGTYKTLNSIFTYEIQSFNNATTGMNFSSMNYEAWDLDRCSVPQMDLLLDAQIHESSLRATINCSLPGNASLIATTAVDATLLTQFARIPASAPGYSARIAESLFRLLKLTGTQVVNIRPTDTLRVRFAYELQQNATIRVTSTTITGITWAYFGNTNGEKKYIGDVDTQTIHNYIYVFWSAILTDLGSVSEVDLFTNTTTLARLLINPPSPSATFPTNSSGHSPEALSELGLPLDSTGPSRFTNRYLCHTLSWKPAASLVVDVLVATLSFFMAYWATLNLALSHFAKRNSSNGNYCACPNCDKIHDNIASEEFGSKDWRSTDELLYKPVASLD